mmetsp:Transcript_21199/g.36414  ORF Transcript_21199/g.36414 Transcript_21199/m.36414 type:complete len:305 (+) Transcript_21199:590-1504(+)
MEDGWSSEEVRCLALDIHNCVADVRSPSLQPLLQPCHLVDVEDAGLDPGDTDDLQDLVDVAPHEPKRKRLHHQELNLVDGELGGGCDDLEGNGTVVASASEDELHEGQDRDLLLEGVCIRDERRLGVEISVVGDCQALVLGYVAGVEDVDQVGEPGEVGAIQGRKDGMRNEFAEVVDSVGDEGGESKVRGENNALLRRQRVRWRERKEAQRVLVELRRRPLALVVISGYSVEAALNDGISAVDGFQGGLAVVDDLFRLLHLVLPYPQARQLHLAQRQSFPVPRHLLCQAIEEACRCLKVCILLR